MGNLGKKLQELRRLKHLTLRQVEKMTGISNPYLSQLENDKIKSPSATVLYKLADVYNVSVEFLLNAAGILRDQKSESPLAYLSLTPEEETKLLEFLRFLRWKEKPEETTVGPNPEPNWEEEQLLKLVDEEKKRIIERSSL